MIIRLTGEVAAPLLKERTRAPDDIGGEFGKIDLLKLTSAELRERFGITLSPADFLTTFEVVDALTSGEGRPTDAVVRKNRIARLIQARPTLLPCFIAYQEMPDGALLPQMTDAHESKWSLFFDRAGRMTLAEYEDGWRITPDAELAPLLPLPVGRLAETKGFLLSRFATARKMMARSDQER